MPSVVDFLATLPEAQCRSLIGALGDGLESARLAALAVTEPAPGSETVTELLTHLAQAIERLETAREVLTRYG
jgi:hypothetical protein